MGRLKGKVAMVTGGGRGMGRSHAVHLAREGADVVVCGIETQLDIVDYPLFSPGDLEETVRLVEEEGQRGVAVVADVGDHEQMKAVADAAIANFGRLDIVCANAGYLIPGTVQDISPAAWEGAINTHLTGVFNALNVASPHFIEQQFGRFIATASTFGRMGAGNNIGYVAAKWGVIGLVKGAAVDLGPHNVTCNAVVPSTTRTMAATNDLVPRLFFPDEDEPSLEKVEQMIEQNWHHLPVGMIPPEDISNAVVFLASEEARYISGSTVDVTAGMSANYTA